MSDAAGPSMLSLQEITDIIAKARSAGADPILIGMQIFHALGDNVTLAGETLRLALTAAALAIAGPLAAVVTAIQSVSKLGSHVTAVTSQEVQATLSGIKIRFKKEMSFDIDETAGTPALNNIVGVSAHEVFWIDIKSIQLKPDQGQMVVRVVTSAGTREFRLG